MQTAATPQANATVPAEPPFRGWYESSRELETGLMVRELEPALTALFFRLLGSEGAEAVPALAH